MSDTLSKFEFDSKRATIAEYGVWQADNAVMTCGPHTGHSVKAIAYCADAAAATLLGTTSDLLRALRALLEDVKPAGSDGYCDAVIHKDDVEFAQEIIQKAIGA